MMRTAKILMLALTLTGSLILGVSGAADASSAGSHQTPKNWCCG